MQFETFSPRSAREQGQGEASFRVLLTPNCSLSPAGFLVLMACICTAGFVSGLVFLAMGAWPVTAFFGLDILLLYVAFKLNYRSARHSELIEIDVEAVTITRTDPKGRVAAEQLGAYWVRVVLEPDGRRGNRLAFASHGRSTPIGPFLTDDERRELAGVLRRALGEARVASRGVAAPVADGST